MGQLAGKVAIITGASSGVGLAASRLFASDASSFMTGACLLVDGGISVTRA